MLPGLTPVPMAGAALRPFKMTNLGVASTTVVGGAIVLTLPAAVEAKSCILVFTSDEATVAIAPGGSMADTAGNTYTVPTGMAVADNSASAFILGQCFRAFNTAKLNAGDTITYTRPANGREGSISVVAFEGVPFASDPLDAATINVLHGNTNPIVSGGITSGVPTAGNEYFVCCAMAIGWSGMTFTHDSANLWSTPPLSEVKSQTASPNTSACINGENQHNMLGTALTWAPAWTGQPGTRRWVAMIVGIKTPNAPPPGVSAFPTIAAISTQAPATSAGAANTLTCPATVNAGDLLIACLGRAQNSQTFTPPSGWTEIGDVNVGAGGDISCTVAYKIADGSEGGTTIAFTSTSGSNVRRGGFVIRVTNWHGTTPPEIASTTNTTGADPDPPSLIPSWGSDDTEWIAFVGGTDDSTGCSAPSGYTNLTTSGESGASKWGVAMATRDFTSASENPGAFNYATNPGNSISFTIGVRPTP